MNQFLILLSILAIATATHSDVTYFIKQQQENIDKLHQHLKMVSDPDSSMYGQYLSHEEVIELQRPSILHQQMVEEHLINMNIEYTKSLAGDKIVAKFPNHMVLSESLEQLQDIRKVFVPEQLESAIDTVSGMLLPWKIQSKQKRIIQSKAQNKFLVDNPMDCLKMKVTPDCLRKAYGLQTSAAPSQQNKQMVIVNQYYKPTDITDFQKKYSLPQQAVVKDIGKQDGTAGTESSLDLEYIMTTGQKVPTWWFYIDGHINNPFASWLTWSANNTDIPLVHSLSVGGDESEFARDNGGDIAIQRMNDEMAALGVRGVSILFASGDSGYVQNLKYGASSPFVTAIGGVFNGDLGDDVLQADYVSTGGVSSMKPNGIQDWQKNAVESYMKTSGQRPSKLDTSKRFVPDISAYDAGYQIIQNGNDNGVDGTSAATPVVAGMVSVINDVLLSKGLKPLGFLNPFLYKNADLFLDITSGGIFGFKVSGINGIDAVKGYDPASGLGTFDSTTFQKLLNAAIAAQTKQIVSE